MVGGASEGERRRAESKGKEAGMDNVVRARDIEGYLRERRLTEGLDEKVKSLLSEIVRAKSEILTLKIEISSLEQKLESLPEPARGVLPVLEGKKPGVLPIVSVRESLERKHQGALSALSSREEHLKDLSDELSAIRDAKSTQGERMAIIETTRELKDKLIRPREQKRISPRISSAGSSLTSFGKKFLGKK